MRSVMNHNFSMVPQASIPRSTFNRSHGYKTTFPCSTLIPFYVDEALPGDTFNLKVTSFSRLNTLIVPMMDNMRMDFHFFAVPNRLVWDNWQKFMGEQTNPGDSTDYVIPVVDFPGTGLRTGDIFDYFGLPFKLSGSGVTAGVSSLPFRAYSLIYNEWFRDENLQDSVIIPKGDGPDFYEYLDSSIFLLRKRNKRHDYFTSCLPWPQKGPGVELPLGTEAPIKVFEQFPMKPPTVRDTTRGNQLLTTQSLYGYLSGGSPDLSQFAAVNPGGDVTTSFYDPNGSLYADLSQATAATINSLRLAFQMQKFYERDARGGTRYTEILRSHFSVISPDARLQRPEFLGGGSAPLIINPVAQSSGTSSVLDGYTKTPQANLAAYGVCSSHGHGFVKSFVEHSIIIGLVSVVGDITYAQGINRMWTRKTKFDFYWPVFAHLGEQAVLEKEIYYDPNPALPDNQKPDYVFGYQERWAEYRYKPSMVTCLFRPGTGSTGFPPANYTPWTLCDEFSSSNNPAVLNSDFIVDATTFVLPRSLYFNSDPGDDLKGISQILFDSYIDIRCARPMPVYSVPGNTDRF